MGSHSPSSVEAIGAGIGVGSVVGFWILSLLRPEVFFVPWCREAAGTGVCVLGLFVCFARRVTGFSWNGFSVTTESSQALTRST